MEKHQLQFEMGVYNDLKIKMAWQSFFNIVVVIFNIQLSLFIIVFNLKCHKLCHYICKNKCYLFGEKQVKCFLQIHLRLEEHLCGCALLIKTTYKLWLNKNQLTRKSSL